MHFRKTVVVALTLTILLLVGTLFLEGVGGKTGPDLSKVGARRKPDWLMVQIRDPKKNDHDSPMPAYDEEKINAKDLKALVAYLGSLK